MASAVQETGRNLSFQCSLIWHHFISGGSFSIEWHRDCLLLWLRSQRLPSAANDRKVLPGLIGERDGGFRF